MSYLIKHAGYRARGAAAGALLGAASGAGLKAYYNKQLGRNWNHNLGGSALAGAAIGGVGGFAVGRNLAANAARRDRDIREAEESLRRTEESGKRLDKALDDSSERIRSSEELLGRASRAQASITAARRAGVPESEIIKNIPDLDRFMTE